MASAVRRVIKAADSRDVRRDFQEMDEESCRADGFFSTHGRLSTGHRVNCTDDAIVWRLPQAGKEPTPPRPLLLSCYIADGLGVAEGSSEGAGRVARRAGRRDVALQASCL